MIYVLFIILLGGIKIDFTIVIYHNTRTKGMNKNNNSIMSAPSYIYSEYKRLEGDYMYLINVLNMLLSYDSLGGKRRDNTRDIVAVNRQIDLLGTQLSISRDAVVKEIASGILNNTIRLPRTVCNMIVEYIH